MTKRAPNPSTDGAITVTLDNRDVIVCTMRGFINGPLVRESLAQTRSYALQLQRHNRPAYLFIDAREVTGQNSDARSQAKTLSTIGLSRIAVCNRSRALGIVIRYLISNGGMARYARVFRTPLSARHWLLQENQPQGDSSKKLRIWLGIVTGLIALAALVGWAVKSDILTAIVPSLRPMNPVVGLLLLLQMIVLFVITKNIRQAPARRFIVGGIAIISVIFGSLILLQISLATNFHIDDWLFGSQLYGGALSGITSPRSAILLTLVGVMECAILSGQRARWQQYLFHTASVTVFCLAVLAIVGHGFGLVNAQAVLGYASMPLNTAISFLLVNHALQTVANPLPFFAKSWRFTAKYSYAIGVGLLVIFMTGIAWQQSNQDQQQSQHIAAKEEFDRAHSAIEERVNAYVNVLRGYQSFFQASDFVSAKEYQSYFSSSKISDRYPGFSAISFARSVPVEQKSAFESTIRTQADASFPTYRNFAVYPSGDRPMLYPITYVEPHTTTTNYGFDLGSSSTRRSALERARDSGDVAATDTIDLNASRSDASLPKRPGFFIAIPVYTAKKDLATVQGRRDSLYGFVNAVFEDSVLFKDIFKTTARNNVKFVIHNASSGETLYTYNPTVKNLQQDPVYTGTIMVAGQVWRLSLYTPSNFGVSELSTLLPSIILGGGFTMAMLAAALTASQARRRDEAVKLAAAMTEDLNNERDLAVTTQQKDEAILSSIGDAVFAIDKKGVIIIFNRAAAALTGYSQKEALGRQYDELFSFRNEQNGQPVQHFIAAALKGRQTRMPSGTVLQRADGTTIPVADSAAPITDAAGAVEGAVVVFRDTTRERQLERLKDEFVSVASHELRTPMGAIRAFTSMILAGDYGPVNKNLIEPLTDIRGSTLHLVNLVNDLLDVARIEAGRMKLEVAPVDLSAILHDAAKGLTPLAQEKNVRLKAVVTKNSMAQADPDKIKQVVTNLVGNALKFTDKGSITLATTDSKDAVEVTVTDTGIGISQADQSRLFGKFEQINSKQEGRPPGTGLGLYISRQIVEKLGGTMYLKSSTPGKGSVFAFTLPKPNTAVAKKVAAKIAEEARVHPDQK